MVWTWQWIFTPALSAGLAGFILLLGATEETFVLIGLAAIALAAGGTSLCARGWARTELGQRQRNPWKLAAYRGTSRCR
jgi:hypothetical protein